jgi:hypothetical protein
VEGDGRFEPMISVYDQMGHVVSSTEVHDVGPDAWVLFMVEHAGPHSIDVHTVRGFPGDIRVFMKRR